MQQNSILDEFVVYGKIDDVNAEIEKRGLSSMDILSVQFHDKPNLPIGESRASYRVIARSS